MNECKIISNILILINYISRIFNKYIIILFKFKIYAILIYI